MWRPRRNRPDPDDPRLLDAERKVRDLRHRARHVERFLTERHERNHWSETVEQLWRGEARA